MSETPSPFNNLNDPSMTFPLDWVLVACEMKALVTMQVRDSEVLVLLPLIVIIQKRKQQVCQSDWHMY